jgi:hydroxymethylglutaryl-CoA lyase
MGFGHGDPWNVEIVGEWTEKLSTMGWRSLSSDTGGFNSEMISYLQILIPQYPEIEFGAHLHTTR